MTENTNPTPEPTDDELTKLPPERLAELVRAARKEAADRRGELRTAEAARDTLQGTVTEFQRSAFHSAAEKAGVAPTALADLDALVSVESVLSDAGTLDQEKAVVSLQELRASKPHLFTPGPSVSGAEGFSGAGTPEPAAPTWGGVLARG